MSEIEHERQKIQGQRVVPQMADLLNEGQRRSLGTVLRRLERAAWQLEEQMSRGLVPPLALTDVTHVPTMVQQEQLVRLAQCVRQDVVHLAEDSGVKHDEEDRLRTLHAQFTLLWVELEDVRPQKLRHYGPLHPHLMEALGPRIQHISELVLALDAVVSGTHESTKRQNMVNTCNEALRARTKRRDGQ